MKIHAVISIVPFYFLVSASPMAVPQRYRLTLSCMVDKGVYEGIVSIDLKGISGAVRLDSLVDVLSVYVDGVKSEFQAKDEELVVKVDKSSANVKVHFRNKIGTCMAGFYRSNANGSWMWSTHFEANDARRAFPCIDRPDMKAAFSIRIIAPRKFDVISNSDVKKTFNVGNVDLSKVVGMDEEVMESGDILNKVSASESEKENRMTIFNDTPKMSTYLVAFVIGEMDHIRRGRVAVYTTKGISHGGQFALSVAERALDFFERYFSIKYPLRKLDLVAVPEFAMGAMENWGLITFRQVALLYFEGKSNPSIRKGIADTICHEIAHQWFGNLVTMKWWDNLWLNEGFATWASSLAMENEIVKADDDPQLKSFKWNVAARFVNLEVMEGLEHDSLISTHPILVKVKHPSEIDQIFDEVSYSKGSSLIRMMSDYVDEFRKKLSNYLSEYSYSNTDTSDLFKALGASDIMDGWIREEGYPLIYVTRDKIEQKRFVLLSSKYRERKPYVWSIPIKIDWLDGNMELLMFDAASSRFTPKRDIFKVNSGIVGFYRVKYWREDVTYQLIKEYYVNGGLHRISEEDVIGLVSDYHALIMAGDYKIKSFIKIAELLKAEKNFDIVLSVLSALSGFKYFNYEKFRRMIVDFVEGYGDNIFNTDEDNVNDVSLSSYLVDVAVANRSNVVMSKLLDMGMKSMYGKAYLISAMIKSNEIDIDKVMCCYGDCKSIEEDEHKPSYRRMFDKLLSIYKESGVPDERLNALTACAYCPDHSIAMSLPRMIGDTILLQDSCRVFTSLFAVRELKPEVIKYIMSHWDYLKGSLKDSLSIFACIVKNVLGYTPVDMVSEVKGFLRSCDKKGIERAVSISMEMMDIHTAVHNNNLELVSG